ncbi:MAG: hypothetical protein V1779_10525 [bacterium]
MNRIGRLGFFNRIILYSFVIVTILFLYSCNEEPTFMGSALLQDTVTIYPLSTSTNELIIAASTFLHHINTINKGVIHIGKANGITALSMVRFTEPIKNLSSDYDFFVNYSIDKIISCKVKLYTNRYTFGDSTNPNALSFKIYKATEWWSNLTTYDSLETFNIIDYSNPVGSFNGSVTQKDSMDNIEIDIDKNVFLDWVKQWYDTKNGDTSVVWGLACVPDENSMVIRQFSGLTNDTMNATEMTVIYLDTAGFQDTLILQKAIDKPFYKVDNYDKNDFIIQGALSLRGLLYFDLSMIPAKSSIHSAQFELTLNRENVIKGNYPMDSTLLAELPSDTSLYDGDEFLRSYYAELVGDKFFFSSITSAVETWNRGTGKGVLVFHPEGAQNERWEFDKLTFYGPNEQDSTKRPVLKIIYSRIGK